MGVGVGVGRWGWFWRWSWLRGGGRSRRWCGCWFWSGSRGRCRRGSWFWSGSRGRRWRRGWFWCGSGGWRGLWRYNCGNFFGEIAFHPVLIVGRDGEVVPSAHGQIQYGLRGLVLCIRLLVVDPARSAPIDHIAGILVSDGVPGEIKIVGAGKCDCGGDKGGGESEEFREKGIHYRKHCRYGNYSNVHARSFLPSGSITLRCWPFHVDRVVAGRCRYGRSLRERFIGSDLTRTALRVFQIVNLDQRDPCVIASAVNNRGIISRRQSRDDGCFAIIGGR